MAKEKFRTSIGGQAVIQGVMMKGPDKTAMCIRKKDNSIHTELWNDGSVKWYTKIPLLRGCINFVNSMISGYKLLMMSADISGFLEEDEEPGKIEKALQKIFGNKLTDVLVSIASIIATIIAVFLFLGLPSAIVKFADNFINIGVFKSVLEGLIRIIIFVCYISITGRNSYIKMVYQYHGAEHKTISCYESGDDLTPENAMKHTRLHPRCGTSFIFISLIISIVVSSFVTWDVLWMRLALKLVLLPLIVGIAYEIIRIAGRHNNIITRIVSFPGLMMQKITTAEPTKEQLEIAIAALNAAKPEDKNADKF